MADDRVPILLGGIIGYMPYLVLAHGIGMAGAEPVENSLQPSGMWGGVRWSWDREWGSQILTT